MDQSSTSKSRLAYVALQLTDPGNPEWLTRFKPSGSGRDPGLHVGRTVRHIQQVTQWGEWVGGDHVDRVGTVW